MPVLVGTLFWFFLKPPSLDGLGGLLTIFAVAAAIIFVTGWVTTKLAGEEMPEHEFRRLDERTDMLAALPPPDRPPTEFDELVMEALDELPEEFHEVLRTTPVTVPVISTGNATSAGTAASSESLARPLTETKPTTPKTSRPGPLPAPKKEVSATPAVKKRLSVATRLKMFGRKK